MRALVTGHDGYVGRLLVPMLLARGHAVVGLDTLLYAGCALGPEQGCPIPALRLDVREVAAGTLAGFDAVVHLAGISNDPLGQLSPELTDEINHRAAVRLAELSLEAGVPRFLFASTCSVYGAAGEELVDEDAPARPLTAYARSKAAAEEGIVALASWSFSPVVLRPGTAYGYSPRLRGDLVVNNLVGNAVASGRVLIRSDGAAWRPLVHVEDIARAFAAALEVPAGSIRERVLNVGSNEGNLRVRDVAEEVARAVPGARVVYAPGGEADERSYRVSFARLERVLPAARPARALREGCEELAAELRREAIGLGELEGPRLQRLARIEERLAEGSLDGTLRPAALPARAAVAVP